MDDTLTTLIRLVAKDEASSAVKGLERNIRDLDKTSKSAGQGVGGLGKHAKSAVSGITNLNNVVIGAASAFAGLKLVQVAGDLVAQGEVVRKNTNTFRALTGGVNEAGVALDALRARTRGMVSDTELMAAANNLLKSNLAKTSDEAVKLVGITNDLGASTGQLFSVLANQSYAVLDSFGVSANAVRQLKKDYEAAGKSSEEAFAAAFLVEAEKTVARLGTSIEENLSPTQELSVKWTNFWDGVSAGAAGVLNSAVTTAEQLAFIIDHTLNPPEADVETDAEYVARISQNFDSSRITGLPMSADSINQRYQQYYGGGANAGRQGGMGNFFDFSNVQRGQTMPEERGVGAGMGQFSAAALTLSNIISESINAEAENTEAVRASTEANLQLAGNVSSSIEQMLGYVAPDERGIEAGQASVVDALKRAGLSPEEMDKVLSQGSGALSAAAEQGLDITDPQAILAAYGITDTTPGEGYDAAFTGQGEDLTEQLRRIADALGAELPGAGGTNIGGQVGTSFRHGVLGGEGIQRSQAAFGDAILGADLSGYWSQYAEQSPATFGGMSYANMPAYTPTLPWNANQGGGAPGAQTNSYTGFGGDYMQNYSHLMDDLPNGLENAAEQAALLADETHLGAVSTELETSNTEIMSLQESLISMAGQTYNVEIIPTIRTQAAQDALGKFVLEVLKKNGFNIP